MIAPFDRIRETRQGLPVREDGAMPAGLHGTNVIEISEPA
jgi:hypothetical protein